MESFDIFKTTKKEMDIIEKRYFYNAKTHMFNQRSDLVKRSRMHKQFIYNASFSRKDALPYSTNHTLTYTDAGAAYTDGFFTEGKSKAAQMYDDGGEFYNFIEALRQNTSNGMVHGEVIDSIDTKTERVLINLLFQRSSSTRLPASGAKFHTIDRSCTAGFFFSGSI